MFVDAGAFGIALRQEGNVNGSSDSDSLKINMRRIYIGLLATLASWRRAIPKPLA